MRPLEPPPGRPSASAAHDVSRHREAVGAARREVVRIARAAGATQEALVDIELAVSEASTNAVIHSYASPGTRGESFTISTAAEGSLLSVWVTDEGRGGTPTSQVPASASGSS